MSNPQDRTSKTVLDHLREYEVLGPLSSLSIHPETPGLSTGRVYGDTRKAIELIEWQAAVIAAQQERLDGKAADQRASDDAGARLDLHSLLMQASEACARAKMFTKGTPQADHYANLGRRLEVEADRLSVETVGRQCACDQDCQPEQNEGRECRLSEARIPPDHFSEKTAADPDPNSPDTPWQLRRAIREERAAQKTAEFNCTLCQDRGVFFDGIVPGGVPCECKAQKASAECPDDLTPGGPTCPRCGGPRAPSGVGGGSWVHFPRAGVNGGESL